MMASGSGSQPPYTNMQQQQFLHQQQMAMMQGMMPGQMMQRQMMPGQMMPGQMMPGQMMPGQMMPGQMMQGQMMPGQMMPGQNVMPLNPMMSTQRFPGQQAMFSGPVSQRMPSQLPSPPQYTPQMAQEFKIKQGQYQKQQQKYLEEQRKQMEQNMKQQQFKDQQKRLLELSKLGGRKMDASSMIESIIGKSEPVKSSAGKDQTTVSNSVNQPNSSTASNQSCDDGFGDFIVGPSASAVKSGNQQPHAQQPAQLTTQSTLTTQTAPRSTNTQPQPPVATEKKKDIVAMMMECSDLSAPQKARGFVKKSVKEIEPVKKQTVLYNQSQTAHRWNGQMDELTELFTLPETPKTHAQEVIEPPKWLLGTAPVPDVYNMVLEAATVEGQINTERLYPILLRSNLARERLGQLWALCNKASPGQLNHQELFMLLAMISVAQNNLNCSSLDILMRCPQAPIPNLGQAQLPPNNQPTHLDPAGTTLQHLVSSTSPSTLQNGTGQADDEFSDFQVAPSVPMHSAHAPTVASTVPSDPAKSLNSHMKESDKYAALHNVSTEKDDDIDKYFKDPSTVLAETKIIDLHATFKPPENKALNTITNRLETEFPVGLDSDPITTQTDSTMPDFDNFATFQGSQSESSSSQSQGWASSSSISGLTSASSNADDFIDVSMSGAVDEFTEFQQASEHGGSFIKSSDRISALKALVMNRELYNAKANKESEPSRTDKEEDDWAAFTSPNPNEKSRKQVAEPNTKMGFFVDSLDVPPPVVQLKDTWSAFRSKPGPDLTSAFDWEDEGPKSETFAQVSTEDEFKRETNMQVDKSKSEMFFAQNLNNQRSAMLGVPAFYAFDLAPPEFPEIKDDDDDDFDEFGTFQSSDRIVDGISSLAAGLDDLTDLNVMNTKSSRLTSQNVDLSQRAILQQEGNTASNPDLKNYVKSTQKEDNQSLCSWDLRLRKDESPSGFDSQSVCSLEFNSGEISQKSITPQDQRSIASLELKATAEVGSDWTPDITPGDPDGGSLTDSYGSAVFSQKLPEHSPHAQPQKEWNFEDKPRNVSELLTHGDLPAIGDRYSGFVHEPQDTDKHTYYWQNCLEQIKSILTKAKETFNSVSNSDVVEEILSSDKGHSYIKGIVEVYRVFCRIKHAMRGFSVSNGKLEKLVEGVEGAWASLTIYIANTNLMPERDAMDYSKAVQKGSRENMKHDECGVCILIVSTRSITAHPEHTLTYGGRQYHTSCANFWVNCVNSTLPTLSIPELL